MTNAALKLTKSVLGSQYTFEFESVVGSYIILKRVEPSRCPTCERIHHKQHPFLIVEETLLSSTVEELMVASS